MRQTNIRQLLGLNKGEDAYLMHVRIFTLTPTSGDIPFANCLCIIDSYESVVSFADAKGVWGFALSVLNPKFLAPPQHHSRCIDCLLSHLFSLAFTTSSGVQSRAHLGPVSDLIVVSARATKQLCLTACHLKNGAHGARSDGSVFSLATNVSKLILCLEPPMLVVVSRGQLDVV